MVVLAEHVNNWATNTNFFCFLHNTELAVEEEWVRCGRYEGELKWFQVFTMEDLTWVEGRDWDWVLSAAKLLTVFCSRHCCCNFCRTVLWMYLERSVWMGSRLSLMSERWPIVWGSCGEREQVEGQLCVRWKEGSSVAQWWRLERISLTIEDDIPILLRRLEASAKPRVIWGKRVMISCNWNL